MPAAFAGVRERPPPSCASCNGRDGDRYSCGDSRADEGSRVSAQSMPDVFQGAALLPSLDRVECASNVCLGENDSSQ